MSFRPERISLFILEIDSSHMDVSRQIIELPRTKAMAALKPVGDYDASREELAPRCSADEMTLLDQSLQQQAFEVERHVSGRARRTCEQLVFLGAAPRDLVEICGAAL